MSARVITQQNTYPAGWHEAVALKGFNHVVNRRRGNSEVALQIGLSRSLAVDLTVVVDEGKVLALFGRE